MNKRHGTPTEASGRLSLPDPEAVSLQNRVYSKGNNTSKDGLPANRLSVNTQAFRKCPDVLATLQIAPPPERMTATVTSRLGPCSTATQQGV